MKRPLLYCCWLILLLAASEFGMVFGQSPVGTLTINMAPASGWTDAKTIASVTFTFSPACPTIALYKQGTSNCLMGGGCSSPASTTTLWHATTVAPAGDTIQVRGVTAAASGYYHGVCQSNKVSYTTAQSSSSIPNLAIGVIPRIMQVQVRMGYFGRTPFIRNLTLENNNGVDTFTLGPGDIDATSYSTIKSAFGVSVGQPKPTSTTSNATRLALPSLTVDEYDLPSGNYYGIFTRSSTHLPMRNPTGLWFIYDINTDRFLQKQICKVESYATTHLLGAPEPHKVKISVNINHIELLGSISVVRDSNACSCTFSCDVFKCPKATRMPTYAYKFGFYDYPTEMTPSQFLSGNVPGSPHLYRLNKDDCQDHFRKAMGKSDSYKIMCRVFDQTSRVTSKYEKSVKVYDLLRQCAEDEFQCPSTLTCIPMAKVCNSHNDCSNGEDEANCTLSNLCPAGEVRCPRSNECIVSSMRCDGTRNCNDGWDEQNCQNKPLTPCPRSFFICTNGRCVNKRDVCDGFNDCGDSSDEVRCGTISPQTICSFGQFTCLNKKCITKSYVCDTDNDCDDNSDENSCGGYYSRTCRIGNWQCHSGSSCIPAGSLCDGQSDCDDGSDELICGGISFPSVGSSAIIAPSQSCLARDGKFLCSNGRCIVLNNVCNGRNECGDFSDENTDLCNTCPSFIAPRSFKCQGPGRQSACISASSFCDGVDDCGNRWDETICGTCSSANNLFRCATNFKCIHESLQCNMNDDCGDASDETMESCNKAEKLVKRKLCPANSIMCRSNGRCVPDSKLCDGTTDCCSMPATLSFGTTVPMNATHLGSCEKTDEIGCQTGQSCFINNGGCNANSRCVSVMKPPEPAVCGGMTPPKEIVYCACSPGYRKKANSVSECEDIDECQTPFFNNCTNHCENTQGSYKCSCANGFVDASGLSADETTGLCVPSDSNAEPPTIVYMYDDNIRLMKNGTEKIVVHTPYEFQTQDVDIRNGTIIFVDIGRNTSHLSRVPLPSPSNPNPQPLMMKSKIAYGHVMGISIDFLGDNVYVFDSPKFADDKLVSRITVSKTNGLYQKVLGTFEHAAPGALAVNPFKGVMYYTLVHLSGKVASGSWIYTYFNKTVMHMQSMNGSKYQLFTLFEGYEYSERIYTIAIDYLGDNRVYYIQGDIIKVMNHDGSSRSSFNVPLYPSLMDVFDVYGSMLFGFFSTNEEAAHKKSPYRIYEVDKFSRSMGANRSEPMLNAGGVRIYHPLKAGLQSSWPKPCPKDKCSHLCLLNMEGGSSCACPDGEDDKTTCTSAVETPPQHPGECFEKCKGVCVKHVYKEIYKCSCLSPLQNGTYCESPSHMAIAAASRQSEGQSYNDRSSLVGGIIFLAVVLFIFIVVVGVAAFFWYRRRQDQQSQFSPQRMSSLSRENINSGY